jgi:hypothetical protein
MVVVGCASRPIGLQVPFGKEVGPIVEDNRVYITQLESVTLAVTDQRLGYCATNSEPVFLNVYGAQELIPRNEFRQPI